MKLCLVHFISLLVAADSQGWMEFGRKKNEKPVLQRKRLLGLEHVPEEAGSGYASVDSRFLVE